MFFDGTECMKIIKSLAVLALVATQAPLLADETPPKKEEAAKKDPNQRIVCHTQDEIGSRLRKTRTCLTVAQWRELNDQAGMMTERKEVQTMMRGGG